MSEADAENANVLVLVDDVTDELDQSWCEGVLRIEAGVLCVLAQA